jgi:hypothetical protein
MLLFVLIACVIAVLFLVAMASSSASKALPSEEENSSTAFEKEVEILTKWLMQEAAQEFGPAFLENLTTRERMIGAVRTAIPELKNNHPVLIQLPFATTDSFGQPKHFTKTVSPDFFQTLITSA